MTPEEITRTIAEWMGECIHDFEHNRSGQVWQCKKCGERAYFMRLKSPASYTSLDALQPVLAKFTPEMRLKFGCKLANRIQTQDALAFCYWTILTLPASTLSRLVAETIKEKTFEPSTEGSKP